jgi:hypothetical protein
MASYPPRFGPRLWPIIHLDGKRLDAMIMSDRLRARGQETEEDYEKKRQDLYDFLHNLDSHVPCITCSRNFLKFRDQHPLPDMRTSEDGAFFRWTVDLHNHANEITGKRHVGYDEAEQMFQDQWMNMDENFKLADAQVHRLEDHKKIKDLEEELKHLKQGEKLSDSATNTALLASLVVVGILSAAVIVFLIAKLRAK